MDTVLDRWGSVATVPVTAKVLERHPEIAKDLLAFDVGIHAYRHVPYDRLAPEAQAEDLDKAMELFVHHGIKPRGFRAPYLRANETTIQLLRDRGMLWDSSKAHFVLPRTHPAAALAKGLAQGRYSSIGASQAHVGTSFPVELPVALPDDEILVDGLALTRPSVLDGIYSAMLDGALATGSALILQVHPERFHICAESIKRVLSRARNAGAWIASLTEIATWVVSNPPGKWPRSTSAALAISGDLDALSIGDFTRRVMDG